MPIITRQLPNTVEGRILALTTAKEKEAHLLPGIIIISALTKTRLLAICSSYLAAELAVSTATSASTLSTRNKNEAQTLARMWSSHYYQALNNGIERAVYAPEVRSFYSLAVSSDAVPPMDSEDKVKLWGGRVTTGEAALILAGGTGVLFPTEPQVKIRVTDYVSKLTLQSSAVDATDSAEETLNGLNDEADKVIKKVWDEVETYYNEETAESMRANAREWGVKYSSLGNPTNIIFKAERADTHAGIEAAVFKIESTGNTYTAGPDGTIAIETRLVGDETVIATHPDFVTLTLPITIVEGVAMTVTFSMVAA